MNSQEQRSRAFFAIPAAVMVLALSGGSVAAESVAGGFSHKDWDLTCDNTLTCRAVGYGAIAEEEGASVLLTRKAGSNEPVTNRVMLAHYGDDEWQEGSAPELIIAGRTAGALSFAGDESWQMSEAQLAQFLTALKQDKSISFRENDDDYSLSGAGSSAVLLKMDDVQGRVNTPGAILRKGKNSESSVKAPIAIPVIVKAPVIDKYLRQMTAQEEAVFRPVILQALGADAETFCSEERLAEPLEIGRLDEQRSLVVAQCWLAAYNGGEAYFEINNDMQSAPVLVSDSANGYDNGVISSGMKGRGLGDCWSYDEWVWNGTEFVSSKRGDTGRCMMMRVGGAWDLPLHVTEVVEQ